MRVVLVTLLLSANRPVSMPYLVDRLWDGSPPAAAQKAVQLYVTRLRAALGSGRALIQTVPGGYQLNVAADQLDLLRFENLVAGAEQAPDQQTCADMLREALDLWRGEPCPDVVSDVLHADDLPRLVERRLMVAERHAELELTLGRYTEAVPRLRILVAEASLRERFWVQLIRALHGAGRRAEALSAYREIAGRLAEELGVDPGSDLRAAHQAVLNDEVPSPPARRAVPRQLPADLPWFIGRRNRLALLDKHLPGEALVAVDGPGGVGKTSLVLHWAHQHADLFPDGQLFVDLRGPGHAPDNALGAFLRALGEPAERIPADLDERAALFRSVTADKRLLIVLDNAADAAQVRPFLPGPVGVVIVTSRQRLRGLAVRNGAVRVALTPFGTDEAVELLARLAGGVDPDEMASIADRCGGLALPLMIMGHRLADGTPAARLLDELAAERGRLNAFDVSDDVATDVRAMLVSAYAALPGPAARLFRLFGTWPTNRITVPAAAALAAVDIETARRLLGTLVDAHHLRRVDVDRFEIHDLMHALAADLCANDPERAAALARVLSWCLHSSHNAARRIGDRRVPQAPPLAPGVTAEEFLTEATAQAWFDEEFDTLTSVVELAVAHDRPEHAWPIVAALTEYRERRARWADHRRLIRLGVSAARAAGDRRGERLVVMTLANNELHLGQHAAALENFRRGLELARELGDEAWQAAALGSMARALYRLGRIEEALGHLEQSLAAHQRLGHRLGEALDLHHMAMCHLRAGDHAKAIALDQQSLRIHVAASDRFGAALVQGQLGEAHLAVGAYGKAIDYFRAALDWFRRTGSAYETDAATMLAEALHHAGERSEAESLARAAAATLRTHHTPASINLLTRLRATFPAVIAEMTDKQPEPARPGT
nr:BTAD domain-containing putative transcriptional regulator [Kibdelosporangium phytohabitans]